MGEQIRGFNGPYDSSDLNAPVELVSFGSLAFSPNPTVIVKAEIEEGSGRIVAITFEYKDSFLQIQAFASPKGISIWEEVIEDITANLTGQGLAVQKQSGPFGLELLTELALGTRGTQPVRMFGVSGERWLLRGTISGKAIEDLDAKTFLEDVFRGIVVNRGEVPLPPRELLPLELPVDAIVPRSSL